MKKITIFLFSIFLTVASYGQTLDKANIRIIMANVVTLFDSLAHYAPLENASFIGTTVISRLNVGSATSATKAEVDSVAMVDLKLAYYIGSDTTDVYTTVDGRQELDFVAVLKADTLLSSGIYYTQRQIDSIAALKANIASPTFTGIPAAPTAAAGTNTTQIATTAFVLSNSTAFSRLQFIVDSTSGAPNAGDSILILPQLINKHLEITRNGVHQYRLPVGQLYDSGYFFQSTTGTLTFSPQLATSEHLIIISSDSTKWTEQSETAFFNTEFLAVYNEFDTKPDIDTAFAMNAMVYSLDTLDFEGVGSVWDRMDLFYCFAVHEADDESLINWASPGNFTATNVSSTAFVRYQGYNGDGTADYLNTNWIAATDGVNYRQDSATIGIYLWENIQEDSKYAYGESTTNGNTYLYPRNTSDQGYHNINAATGDVIAGMTDASGLWITTRTASNACATYRNGSLVDSMADASGAVPDGAMYILNRNGANGYSANTVGIFFVLNGVSADEAAAINTIITTYINAISD